MGAGDLLIDGVSAVLGVNILIMMTNTPDKHPFDLHTPAALGGELKHQSPIFLMYSQAGSHYEEARPLDAASEAKLLVVQETFLKHSYWPRRYESEEGDGSADPASNNLTSDNECSLTLKTPRRRKLLSMKQPPLPLEFSPNEDADGISGEATGADQEDSFST